MAETIAATATMEEKVGLEEKVEGFQGPESYTATREQYIRPIEEMEEKLSGNARESESQRVDRMYDSALKSLYDSENSMLGRAVVGLENRLNKYRVGKKVSEKITEYFLGRYVKRANGELKDLDTLKEEYSKANDKHVGEISDLQQRKKELAVDFKQSDSTIAALTKKKAELDEAVSKLTRQQTTNPWSADTFDKIGIYSKERKAVEEDLRRVRGTKKKVSDELCGIENKLNILQVENAYRTAAIERVEYSKNKVEEAYAPVRHMIEDKENLLSLLKLIKVIDYIDSTRKRLVLTFGEMDKIFAPKLREWKADLSNDNGTSVHCKDVLDFVDATAKKNEERVNEIVERALA